MKNILFVLLFCLLASKLAAQPNITSLVGCTSYTLTATTVPGITLDNSQLYSDDSYSDSIHIGFLFNFYGSWHSELVIGENGMLTFDTTDATGGNPWSISAPLLGNPTAFNSVCAPWCDIDGVYPDSTPIYYSVQGIAPYRTFAATWCGNLMYSCTTQWITTQIIIYETTNNVEVHIGHKDTCTWNGGHAIVGVENADGSVATAAPGRDYPSVWYGLNEGWRFTPNSTYTSYSVSSIPYAPIPYAGAETYWYDSTTGAFIDSGTSITVSPTDTTTYVAAVLGCDDTDKTYIKLAAVGTIVGERPPITSFADSIHLGCSGDSVFLTNLSTPVSLLYTPYWYFGDGSPVDSVENDPVHVYADGITKTGTYNITLIDAVTKDKKCADTVTKTVTFNHPIKAAFIPDHSAVCLGVPINFDNSSYGNGASYLWNFGDGTSDTAKDPTHTYTSYGTYNVVLVVTDTIPCTATTADSVNIVYIDMHTSIHDTSVCLTDSMNLHAFTTVYGNVENVSYLWTPSGNIGESHDSVAHFFGVGNFTYMVTATTTPLGCTASDTEAIVSYAPITFTGLTPSQSLASGTSINLNADGAVTYYWTPNDGTLDNANINDPVATPVDSITTYTVYGMNTFGCLDSANITITLTYSSPEFVPSAFSPNKDGLNDLFKVGNLQNDKLVDFRVYNRWGQQIFQTANPEIGWDGTFNGTPQDVGTYNYIIIISRQDGTEKTFTGSVTLIR